MTLAPEDPNALGTPAAPVDWEYGGASSTLDGQLAPPSPLPPRRGRLRRRWKSSAAIVLVAAVVGGGAAYYLLNRSSGSSGYRTVAVTTGDIREESATTGTIEPATQADVNFAVAGTVNHLGIASGQKVKAGQVLATLGTSTLLADLQQAQASVDSAEAKLASDTLPSRPTPWPWPRARRR
jgi:multidrug efflux pump subunit AcrA (membrane-fusion protein)